MALRSAVASADVSREVGRGGHRLGAFSLLRALRTARLSVVRRLLVLVSSILFVDAMLFVALTPLIPGYADEFGLSDTGAGLLVAAFGLGAVARRDSRRHAGAADRCQGRGRRRAGRDQHREPRLRTGGRSLAPRHRRASPRERPASAVWAGALAWLTVVAPRERRGQVLGTAFGVAIAGAIVGPMLGGLADVVGTRPSFTGVAVAAAMLAALALRAPAAPREHAETGRRPCRTARRRLHRRDLAQLPDRAPVRHAGAARAPRARRARLLRPGDRRRVPRLGGRRGRR